MSFFQEQNADSAEKISPITLCTIFQPKKSNLVGFKKKPLQLVKRETQKTLKRDDHGLAITLWENQNFGSIITWTKSGLVLFENISIRFLDIKTWF